MENVNSNCKRIFWIDGIKGISCFFIFFHHFWLFFFPSSYYGLTEPTRLNGIDTFLSTSPIGIIINGNFFVHLFILISGYVVTYQIIFMQHEKIGFFLIKKYLKLIFSLGIYTLISLLTYFFYHIHDSHALQVFVKQIHKSLESLFFGILFEGDTFLGSHFWMLNYIFLGGIFISIISSLCWITNGKKVMFIPIIIAICLFLFPSTSNCHFASIFLGSALCMLNTFYSFGNKMPKFLLIFFLFSALFFSAFPTGVTEPQNFYKFFLFPVYSDYSRYYWHSFGSCLIFFLISKNYIMQQFFSKKAFQKLSKISFWIYLFHIYILSLSRKIIEQLNIKYYAIHTLLILMLSTILLFSFSKIFAKYVTPIENKFIEKLLGKYKNVSANFSVINCTNQ